MAGDRSTVVWSQSRSLKYVADERAGGLRGQGVSGDGVVRGGVEQPEDPPSRAGEGLAGLRGAPPVARRLPGRARVPAPGGPVVGAGSRRVPGRRARRPTADILNASRGLAPSASESTYVARLSDCSTRPNQTERLRRGINGEADLVSVLMPSGGEPGPRPTMRWRAPEDPEPAGGCAGHRTTPACSRCG